MILESLKYFIPIIKFDSKIGTLCAKIQDKSLFTNPNIVKVITKESLDNVEFSKALIEYFEIRSNISMFLAYAGLDNLGGKTYL